MHFYDILVTGKNKEWPDKIFYSCKRNVPLKAISEVSSEHFYSTLKVLCELLTEDILGYDVDLQSLTWHIECPIFLSDGSLNP